MAETADLSPADIATVSLKVAHQVHLTLALRK